jgi:hypothetical protein
MLTNGNHITGELVKSLGAFLSGETKTLEDAVERQSADHPETERWNLLQDARYLLDIMTTPKDQYIAPIERRLGELAWFLVDSLPCMQPAQSQELPSAA